MFQSPNINVTKSSTKPNDLEKKSNLHTKRNVWVVVVLRIVTRKGNINVLHGGKAVITVTSLIIWLVCVRNVQKSSRCSQDPPGSINATEESQYVELSYFLSFSEEILVNSSSHEYHFPHVEWDGNKFCYTKPQPLPHVELQVRPMIPVHNICHMMCVLSPLMYSRIHVCKHVFPIQTFCRY